LRAGRTRAGVVLYGFGIFIVIMFVTSLRTNLIVLLALAIPVFASFFLAAGNYGGHTTLIHWGGCTGLAAAACAFYLALAELGSPRTAGRAAFPIWPFAAR
jgi:uncharacterized protein